MQRMVVILCFASFSMKAMDVLFGPSQTQLDRELIDLIDRDSNFYRKPIPKAKLVELLEQGANPNIKLDIAMPLYIAVDRGDTEACKILLEKGAWVNYPKNTHSPPLVVALADHNTDTVKLLLQHGAFNHNFTTAAYQSDICKLVIDYAWFIPPFEIPQQEDVNSLVALLISLGHLPDKQIIHRDLMFTFIDSEPRFRVLFLRLLLREVANDRAFPTTFMGLPIPQRYHDIIANMIYRTTLTKLKEEFQDSHKFFTDNPVHIPNDTNLLKRLEETITNLEIESTTKELKENIVNRMDNPPVIHHYVKPTTNLIKLAALGAACTLGAYLLYRYGRKQPIKQSIPEEDPEARWNHRPKR